MNPFDSAWDLLKDLSTEDLRMAARTGGIGMTPERRQAYTDAGLPLNTGGGFRTMPDTEAQRMMYDQRNDGVQHTDFKNVKINPATGQYSDSDWKISPEDQYAALHGGSMQDPSLEQERQRIGRGERRQGESIYSREFDRSADLPSNRNFIAPAPGATGGLVPMEDTGYGVRNRGRSRITTPKRFPGEYGSRHVQEISNAPNQYKDYLDSLQLLNRNKATALPEGFQGPEQFPTSEFARRGDAGASASDKAFSEMKHRKEMAEAEEKMLAERRREIMMRWREKQSRQPKQRAGGRRPGEGKNAYRNRMNRQGGRR
tara:strand:- start:71 stop:1015 length:945 start_codon:yes stop_codon:yes gene_type:complete